MLHSDRSIVKIFLIPVLSAVLFLLFSGTSSSVRAQEGKTVAVLPFAMHAPDSLAYMQDGLRDMLASRLAANGGAVIVDRSRIDALQLEPGKALQQNRAEAIAQQLGTDYVVAGSLTSLGGSMSLDAKVFSRDGSGQPLTFYASAAQENEVISAVNSLSWDIAEKVLGAARPAHTRQTDMADPAQAKDDETMTAFRTEHPEKLIRSQGYSGSALIMARATTGGFTKTQNLDYPMESMDVGDVDGDGQFDVVIADTEHVYAYRLLNNRLIQIGTAKMPARAKIHAVSVGDLDENGRAEIYISAGDETQPHSWAFEWDGSGLAVILDDLPWYIRVIDIPGQGRVLAGQRGGQSSLLRSGIFKLMRNGATVMPEERIIMPDYINLFDFIMADVNGDGAHEIVAISRVDRLYVVRPDGYVLWVSDDYFGGTTRYIGEDYDLVGRVGFDINSSHPSDSDTKTNAGKRLYIPSRMIAMDVNRDGVTDVVVNRNLSTASRHLENLKKYSSGEIHAMTWNGISLAGIWQTRKIDGYIPDFQFLPVHGTASKAKLFVGLVLSTGWTSTLAGRESTILTYDIELATEKESAAGGRN